jgi:lysylphosphatidylglycerol synthetase-like protein (DUF2156 family)
MAAEFNPLGYRVRTYQLGYALIWIGALFVRDAEFAKSWWNLEFKLDHSPA